MITPPVVTDEGRRASDVVNGHLAADPQCSGRWVALRLSDGGSDGTVYDTRSDAIRHQLHESQCAYLKIPPTGMPPADASRLLLVWRMFVAGGFRLQDPDDRREPIMPFTREDMGVLMRAARMGPAWRG